MITLTDNDNRNFPYGFVGGILSVIIPIVLLTVMFNKPKAIEVYQGKTTLEITYKDGIPVDSVVVFKDKKK